MTPIPDEQLPRGDREDNSGPKSYDPLGPLPAEDPIGWYYVECGDLRRHVEAESHEEAALSIFRRAIIPKEVGLTCRVRCKRTATEQTFQTTKLIEKGRRA